MPDAASQETEPNELPRLRQRIAELEKALAARQDTDRSPLERELRIREMALSHSPDFIYVFDPAGRFTYANQALLRLWQKSSHQIIGCTFEDLGYSAEAAETLRAQIRQVIETRQPLRAEGSYAAMGSGFGFYEYILVPVPGADGAVESVVGSTRDITARTQAEAALRESEERFSAAFADAPVGMVITAPGGEFIEANPAYLEMLGYTREEVAAHPSDQFTHPDDVARTHEYGERLRRGDRSGILEKRYVRKDGRIVWARASGTMRHDGEGRATQFIAVIEDVTQRRQIALALERSQDRLRQVFAEAPVAICVLGGPGLVIELANPQFQELLAGRMLVGQPLHLAVPEVSAELLQILERVLTSGEAFSASEFRMPLERNGRLEERWFNFVYQPLSESGGTASAVVVVAVDVSPQVRARQQLEQANRELEEFAYVASHDLQEPLRMVNIYTQLVVHELRPHLTEESRSYAARVDEGVKRMEQLLKDLLKFSHALHSGVDPAEEPPAADLNLSLSRALTVLESRIGAEDVVIETDVLPWVRGDEAQLAQVLQNLVGNAIKYRKPEVPVQLSVTASPQGQEWVVSVRDNGIGFDPEQAERVFGLFKRLHRDAYPGTGLGLAICKRIIERYGGRIWAESKLGEGATFSFALPAAVKPETAESPSAGPPQSCA